MIKILKRSDKLIIQNTLYSGVFLAQGGEFEVYSYRSFDELDGLMISLQYSLKGFSEYISSFLSNKTPLDNYSKFLYNPIFQANEFLSVAKDKRKIPMMTISNNEAIGLSELYDNKTKLYNFTVECVSKDAMVYYIPKEVNDIISKENSVHDNVIQLVELRVQSFTQTLKKYKEMFIDTIRRRLRMQYDMNITSSQVLPYKQRYKQNLRINTDKITRKANSFRDSSNPKNLSRRFSMNNFSLGNNEGYGNNRSIHLKNTSNNKVSFIVNEAINKKKTMKTESNQTLPPIERKAFYSSKILKTRKNLI